MNKVLLICPSNKMHMPYINNYISIFKRNNIHYDILNWDRLNIEEYNELTYEDEDNSYSKNGIQYFFYSKFIINYLENNKYDKVIIFSLQLCFFLQNYLLKKFEGIFLIDVRDYHPIIRIINTKLFFRAESVVISSPGFKKWLPKNLNTIVNHNINFNELTNDEKNEASFCFEKKIINIGFIGSVRYLEINKKLIYSLGGNEKFQLFYHGEGPNTLELRKFIDIMAYENVELTGRYNPKDEGNYYKKNDIINSLWDDKGWNNKTSLANRLYQSVYYAKPLLAYKGTFTGNIIEKYNLGLTIKSFEDLDKQIEDYLSKIDAKEYNHKRNEFMMKVISDNQKFKVFLLSFVNTEK